MIELIFSISILVATTLAIFPKGSAIICEGTYLHSTFSEITKNLGPSIEHHKEKRHFFCKTESYTLRKIGSKQSSIKNHNSLTFDLRGDLGGK